MSPYEKRTREKKREILSGPWYHFPSLPFRVSFQVFCRPFSQATHAASGVKNPSTSLSTPQKASPSPLSLYLPSSLSCAVALFFPPPPPLHLDLLPTRPAPLLCLAAAVVSSASSSSLASTEILTALNYQMAALRLGSAFSVTTPALEMLDRAVNR